MLAKFTRRALIIALVILITLPMQGVTLAQEPEGGDCPCCSTDVPDATVVELTGASAHKVIAQALSDSDVKVLKLALIDAGNTPRVDQARAFQAHWEDTEGRHQALLAVIPFEGNGIAAAVHYAEVDGQEQAIAVDIVDSTHSWLYSVEDGKATYKVVNNPCTYDCIANCLFAHYCNPLALAGCITACISCYAGFAPSCLLCGFCYGYCGGIFGWCIGECCIG